jgi:hypothetical protein
MVKLREDYAGTDWAARVVGPFDNFLHEGE